MQRVVVVGGGVLGMMHAAAARHRGYQVVQLEREAGSRGATVGCLPDACQRGYQFLDPAAVRAVNPALRGAFSCGLLCTRDAIVEPRRVPVAIRDYLLARCSGAG